MSLRFSGKIAVMISKRHPIIKNDTQVHKFSTAATTVPLNELKTKVCPPDQSEL